MNGFRIIVTLFLFTMDQLNDQVNPLEYRLKNLLVNIDIKPYETWKIRKNIHHIINLTYDTPKFERPLVEFILHKFMLFEYKLTL